MILKHHQDLRLERKWQQVMHLSIMTKRTDSCMHVMRSVHSAGMCSVWAMMLS